MITKQMTNVLDSTIHCGKMVLEDDGKSRFQVGSVKTVRDHKNPFYTQVSVCLHRGFIER